MPTMSITIQRTDPWTESFDVYVKAGAYPLEDGDGVFIENVPIEPWEDEVSTTWEAPDDRAWYARAVPVWRREPGPGASL